MALAIIGFLFGGALGVRFKVPILIPAIGLVLLGAAGVGVLQGDPIESVGLTMISIATTLQLGYLTGIVLCAVFVSPAGPMRPARKTRAHAGVRGGPHGTGTQTRHSPFRSARVVGTAR